MYLCTLRAAFCSSAKILRALDMVADSNIDFRAGK
jgi:hypothetical protein